MSERKTAEIKFRVTPDEKARWQRYAADAQLGMSELIRREVNEGIRQNEAQQAAANYVPLVTGQTQEIPGDPSRDLLAPVLEVLPTVRCDGVSCGCADESDCFGRFGLGAPQEDVPSDEVGANPNPMVARLLTDDEIADFRAQSSENVKPDWTFEARNA